MKLDRSIVAGACRVSIVLALLAPIARGATAQQPLPPSPLPGLAYDEVFFPGGEYDSAVPTPDSILGFPVGSKPATPEQIASVVTAIAEHSPRAKLFRYGTTHQGRPLHYLVIASETHIKKLDTLRDELARLADPRSVKAREGDRLAETLPAVAWMAYSIHGDELSAADAALAAAHHLAAGSGEDVRALLDELVVIIDPLMNPDGRERCLTEVAQNRTAQPNVDDQSLIHTDRWPGGRTNHYLFDMNRDWLWATQPETRGRIEAVSKWHPHFFMEGHEMGSQDTFLFFPAREPLNPNFPEYVQRWAEKFAEDHAAAFDAHGWRYYTGEWNESWFPGYSSSWAPLRGAIGNLYEQASIVTDAVRRPEGTLETYRQSVHKQLVSTMANLASLAKNRRAVLRDFLAEKRACVSAEEPHSGRTYAMVPSANRMRWDAFLELLRIQGLEFHQAKKAFEASGVDRLGRVVDEREFPAGTVLIPGRQPEARLLATLMEFDPRMPTEFLVEERRELLRFNQSRLYDVTGWSASMLFDLECITLDGGMPAGADARLVEATVPSTTETVLKHPETAVGFVIDGADDASVVAAGRLMERGVHVRVANKPFALDDREYARGSVLIMRVDNTLLQSDLTATAGEVLSAAGAIARGIKSGLGPGDLPDLGGEHFVLLRKPRVAVVGREPFSPNSYGECWYTIDHALGLRASYLDFHRINNTDLRRYNVIVLPSGPPEALKDKMDALRSWVQAGGTLIAIGSSTGAIAREDGGIGSIRELPAILAKPEPYFQAVIREWEGRTAGVDADAVWSFTAPMGDGAPVIPWLGVGPIKGEEKPDENELKRRDEWKKIFMPNGAVVAGRIDDRSWLTAGAIGDYLPVLYAAKNVLMVPPGAEAPVRVGHFVPAPPDSEKSNAEEDEDKEADAENGHKTPAPGWTIAPPGYELRVRMSGLLWPEAAGRIANSACMAREKVGAGQVILFASDPIFRASTPGTARIFTNAVICGPGMGASQPIDL